MSDDPHAIKKTYQEFQLEEARVTTPTPRTHDSERAYRINDAGDARSAASHAIKEWGEDRSALIEHAKTQLANSRELGKQPNQAGLSKVEQAVRDRSRTRTQGRAIDVPRLKI